MWRNLPRSATTDCRRHRRHANNETTASTLSLMRQFQCRISTRSSLFRPSLTAMTGQIACDVRTKRACPQACPETRSASNSLPILDAADQPEQARDLLFPFAQRFIEGFRTANLPHAQTVLDQLA